MIIRGTRKRQGTPDILRGTRKDHIIKDRLVKEQWTILF